MHDCSARMECYMHSTMNNLRIMNYFRVDKTKICNSRECNWLPSVVGELTICCDSATKDNPGAAGALLL